MIAQNILILCKVVDNFGDIGVVYRLAKALCDARPSLNLTLVVSNLKTFSALQEKISPDKKIQDFSYKNSPWKILDWNLDINVQDEKIAAEKAADENQIILECFQCGRPEWLENILFSDNFTKTVQIVNIDYLTAEDYADDFHLLRSGTRKTSIKKINFMPGFTNKTGGLIFSQKNAEKSAALQEIQQKMQKQGAFNILFFAYEKNCIPIVNAISQFQNEKRKSQKDFFAQIFVAAGKGQKFFIDAWKKCEKPFKAFELSFFDQEEWDFLLEQMDFNFVRGEDSLSRAALSGLPYIWNAYIQDEDYQLVKVNALLERMKPFFEKNDFELLQNAWNFYNKNDEEDCSGEEKLKNEQNLKDFLICACNSDKIKDSFRNFADSIKQNGNLAVHLLDYIDSLEIPQ